MLKLLTVIGARPQIIKAAALSRAIKTSFADSIEEKILHTGQHYDDNMSNVFFCEMGIPTPDFNLHIGSGRHGEQTAKMIAGIEQILLDEKPDATVLFGDTNSTLAGAIAAAKIHVPVVHIEAGLRSFNMAMPEEINRIVCDQLSTILFAPTETAIKNLEREGFFTNNFSFAHGKARQIFNAGDIMYDNSLHFATLAEQKTAILEQLNLQDKKFVLATIHRDNNTDNPERLSAIFAAFMEISAQRGIKIIVPLHPRTKKLLPQNLSADLYNQLLHNKDIQFIPPVSFFEMIVLEKNAQLIMTDSGGLQKEAYFFKKPCVILRPETEWTELLEQKTGLIANADREQIISSFNALYEKDLRFPPVFGNGHAAETMLHKITETFS